MRRMWLRIATARSFNCSYPWIAFSSAKDVTVQRVVAPVVRMVVGPSPPRARFDRQPRRLREGAVIRARIAIARDAPQASRRASKQASRLVERPSSL